MADFTGDNMDTSEQYIKMCEKAEEIQVYKTHRQTDMYLHKGIDGDEVMAGYNLAYVANSIWLPRQDQLQEMVGLIDGVNYHYQDLERHFYEWINRHDYKWRHYTATAEQLWLAFVMKEKYNKVWNGENWG